jgi:hypothetical protein
MAFKSIGTPEWGTSPIIDVDIAYDSMRIGSDVQYQIRITVKPLRSSSSFFGYPIYATVRLDGTTRVSGYTLKGSLPSTWSSAIEYTTGWFVVPNRNTGTTSLVVNLYSGGGSNRNTTYTYAIPVPPRPSSITTVNGTLGEEQTLLIHRYGDNFTHDIYYFCGDAHGLVVLNSSSESVQWTPPLDLMLQSTASSSSVSITLSITTFSGSTAVGTDAKTITASIPSHIKPTARLTLSDPTGHKSTYGGYVQGHSQLTAEVTGEGIEGSTIKSYQIKVGSDTYSGNSKTVDLPDPGELTIQGIVTDSRNRTGSDSETITVLAYNAPSTTKLTVTRCAEDGTEKADGAYAKATFSAIVTALNDKNSAAYAIQYRQTGTDIWNDVEVADAAGDYTPSGVAVVFAAAVDAAFEVRVVATDDFGTAYSSIRTVTVAFALLQTDTTGTGLAVGQRAVDPNTFAVGIPMQINAGISKVATEAAKASRNALGMHKLIWEGTCGAGDTITVEELLNYDVFRVDVADAETCILAFRYNSTHLRGEGGYYCSNPVRHVTYAMAATLDDTALTLIGCSEMNHTAGSGATHSQDKDIVRIYGLI